MPTAPDAPDRAAPDRAGAVERLLADPPVVHAMDLTDDPPLGVWATDPACYRYLVTATPVGARTLETGAGLSTLVFAALGAHHIAVTPLQVEVDRLRAYARDHGVGLDQVRFEIGPSETVLPTLDAEPLDVVLIDGNHGYPSPIIDWFYAGGRLVAGGTLVVDDLQLPAPAVLARLLDRDDRWARSTATAKWGAWTRRDEGPLAQDWFDQPWLRHPSLEGAAGFGRRVAGRLRRLRPAATP